MRRERAVECDAYFAQLALSVLDHALIRRVLEAPILEQDAVRKLHYQGFELSNSLFESKLLAIIAPRARA